MKKRNLILISVISVIAIGLVIYKTKQKPKAILIKKPEAIHIILNTYNHSSEDFLNTLEEDFLITWANAARVNQGVFQYKNNNYFTKGGKRVN